MFYFFFFGLLILGWLSQHSDIAKVVGLFALLWFGYLTVDTLRRSSWYKRREYQREQHAKQRAEDQKDKKLAKKWETTDYIVPTAEQFGADVEKHYRELNYSILYPPLLDDILSMHEDIYRRSNLSKFSHTPTWHQEDYKALLQACYRGLNDFAKALPNLLTRPDAPPSPSPFSVTIPLKTLLGPDPEHALTNPTAALVGHFKNSKLQALFDRGLRPPEPAGNPGTLKEYLQSLLAEDLPDDAYPAVHVAKKQHLALVEKYSRKVADQQKALPLLEQLTLDTPYWPYANKLIPSGQITEPFTFPDPQRFAGTWIVAPPGRGKTNLLHNLIAEDLKQPGTIVLMDSKGDLINSYRRYGDVVVIDPITANINPLQLGSSTRSVEFLEYIFSALLETGMTALQKTLFRSVLTLLLKVPGATLETFRQVLTSGIEPYTEHLSECDPATYDFFTVGKPTEFNSPTYKETKQQILWRLRLVLSNEYLRAIFTAPTTNVPFNELLDSGKVIIIDNSKDNLGEDGAEFFGRFFVALVWMAAVSRSRLRPEQKVPVYFYIDECHTVMKRDAKITTILDECRSQNIALILAHQRVAQIEPHVIDALNNCAIRLANSDDDAESLAKRFRVDAPALRLPVGQFACFVRDKTPQAVTINVPLFDMSIFPPPQTPPPKSSHHGKDYASEYVHPSSPAVPTDEVEDF